MQIKKDIMWRINVSFILMCIMGILIVGQIIKIQFVEGDKWRARADSLTLQYINIAATRGNIFSSDGSLLSTSVPIYDVRMDTRAEALTDEIFNNNVDSLALCMANLFGDHSPSEYRLALREARHQRERFFLLRRNVSYSDLQVMKKFPLCRLGRYKGGILLEQKDKRELPFRVLASRTIGYMRDVKPVGIEASFNGDLKGEGGKRLMQKISGNVWMPVTDKDVKEPRDGNDIITTLDINIQDVAENALKENLQKHNADHGCAVLMEVSTGEVKAIANLSRTKDGDYAEEFNYVVGEATEPGSTMKMASVLAALDDGYIEPEDSVHVGNGSRMYHGQEMKDAHPPHSTKLSIQQAFETSSNVGISTAICNAYSKQPQLFIDKLKSFGMGAPLGLQIEGEGAPYIKSTTDKTWSAVTLPWLSIGYEMVITPLQMLTFYNAIANNGRMVKPHFVKEIRNHGELLHTFPVEVMRDSIASPAALEKARHLMEGVVQHGSGIALSTSSYKVAGKTGTAQIAQNKYGYDKSHRAYQASFVGYFPADAPKYSCMVVVYSPSNDVYYAAAVAVPIFKEIADKVYSTHIDLHSAPSTDTLPQQLPLAKTGSQKELKVLMTALNVAVSSKDDDALNVSAASTDEGVILSERKNNPGVVPDVTGMGMKDAIYILENAGLSVKSEGKGTVKQQSLSPGMKIQRGQQIAINLKL